MDFLTIATDLVAIGIVVTMYFLRHRRRDLLSSYLCVNVGVLAVAQVLAQGTVGVGIGLGLFGVLSIIRLRSAEIAQHEVAYYFASLAMGLVAGFAGASLLWPGVIGLIVLALYVADHPRLLANYRRQALVLDRAITDERVLHEHLAALLGARVMGTSVIKLDLVNDTTVVDVRYRLVRDTPIPSPVERSSQMRAAAVR